MITGPHFYEGLPLQSLAYRYPLLLVCWRQRLHCSSRLFCIVNISSEQCVQLFVLFNLALKKCSMDKFLFLASPDSRGSLEKKNRHKWAWPTLLSGREAQQEQWRGKIVCILFFKILIFTHFHFAGPRRHDTCPCLSQEATPVTRSSHLVRETHWETLEYGGQETCRKRYWLRSFRRDRGNESIRANCLGLKPRTKGDFEEQKGQIKNRCMRERENLWGRTIKTKQKKQWARVTHLWSEHGF